MAFFPQGTYIYYEKVKLLNTLQLLGRIFFPFDKLIFPLSERAYLLVSNA